MSVRGVLVRAPGTNCDRELVRAFEKCGAAVDLIHIQQLLTTADPFGAASIVGFPGGFSYGDDVASGKITAIQLLRKTADATLAEKLNKFIDRGGLVIGICNGFQTLTKAGVLPGLPGSRGQDVTLTNNQSGRFEQRWVRLQSIRCRAEFVTPDDVMEMPSAHGEGQFIARDNEVLQQLNQLGLVAFRYISTSGSGNATYPDNPNGSVENIAGICDMRGRVLGLMPHPERNIEFFHHPHWTRSSNRDGGSGIRLIRNMVEQARRGN